MLLDEREIASIHHGTCEQGLAEATQQHVTGICLFY
jgi:hypothetical protein